MARRHAFVIATFTVTLLLIGLFFLATYRIAGQFSELAETLPAAFGRFVERLPMWLQLQIQQLQDSLLADQRTGLFQHLTLAVGFVFGAITDVILIVFLGLFLAANPSVYREGLVVLVPGKKQERVRDVLHSCAAGLRQWLLGQLISMVAVGVMATIGLLLLGIPTALALGVIAGLLEFVPLIGSLAGAVPAILVGFTVGPMEALWIGVLYLGIQQVEANILQPVIQKWAVQMPPVLILVAGVAAFLLFGLPGIIFAAPLTLVVTILIGKLYVEDTLGRRYNGPAA
jgi:predicted PurR-regulated permease PerM